MHYDIRHAHILDTLILGPNVGAAKAAPTVPCAPGLFSFFSRQSPHHTQNSVMLCTPGYKMLTAVFVRLIAVFKYNPNDVITLPGVSCRQKDSKVSKPK